MRNILLTSALLLVGTNFALARGLIIPTEPDLPPLAMLNHHVDVAIEDQVAITKVRQTFRNHTDRKLEATYIFPIPAGASVRDFAMWIDGERVKGELIPADDAKKVYADVVRQTKNPALLDYIGNGLLSLKIFPIPPQGDQQVEVSFTTVAKKEHGLVEYVYPLKTDRTAASTLEEFKLNVTLKSQQPIGTVYSPTHEITAQQKDDHHAAIAYEEHAAQLDRDFQLFYTTSQQDIGLTKIEHRPISDEDGYVMLLLSPRAELAKNQKVPRDIVFVVDTSGSMRMDKKMDQARAALRHCLGGLTKDDRFGLISFSTTVNHYRDQLVPANDEHLAQAKGWVSDLYPGGGTAIHDALSAAAQMRGDDASRMFTVVFFTDGLPTIGETDTAKILASIAKQNTENTRIFSFGVGDDLNAVFLDQLAEQTRAVNRFVRPGENLETQVASFFGKINHPVLANLKLKAQGDVRLSEVYPPRLPDLFHGDQLVVLARYEGAEDAQLVLEGNVGVHDKQFTYDVQFQSRATDKPFVEELWARRKVGYLLDQIRTNGEQDELVDEVVQLAKSYGITTPYTSYLIMPDAPVELASADPYGQRGGQQGGQPGAGSGGAQGGFTTPAALAQRNKGEGQGQMSLEEFARRAHDSDDAFADQRGRFTTSEFDRQLARAEPSGDSPANEARERLEKAKELKSALDQAQANYRDGKLHANQVRKLGVDLAVSTGALKNQTQLQATATRRVNNRSLLEYGGVWIDEGFNAKTPTLAVKAQSDAYFKLLALHPEMKAVFALGNHVIWITPGGTALIIDTTAGKEQLADAEIDKLLAAK